MPTTIAAQLQAIKSFVNGDTESRKRPFTRPSILFDSKEAADIDLETIYSIAISGLEVLIKTDARFDCYKNTLFSHKSLGLDREVMSVDENNSINQSISSYLRLLSGHFQLSSALKTLEYLIRRYKIHVYNVDDLVLCALPYHDTHVFVRIVQLLDLGNKRWGFLEGVKASGAPPPRKVIVQQCLRDMGVMDTLCDYAMPTKKFQHSRIVVCFCTAAILEFLSATPTLDGDIVKRILPFIFCCLNPAIGGGPDYEAGAMMIVGLLAIRAALAPKLINNFILFIARVARHHAKESGELPWLRMSLMVIINLIQSQSIQVFPKKGLDILKEIGDLPGVLVGLSREFNIEKFLSIYLEGLTDYSSSDDSYALALITTIETGPVKDFVVNIVSKVLSTCTKFLQRAENSDLRESGSWAKQILLAIDKHYPSELNGAVRKFLENSKMLSKQGDSIFEVLDLMFDGRSDKLQEISKSKIWFSLEHPKAEVRRATLSSLAASGSLKDGAFDSKVSITVQEVILRRLHDDDLSVIQAALSLDGLSSIIDAASLVQVFQDVLSRCLDILAGGTSCAKSQACDVAVLCLDYTVLNFLSGHCDYSKAVASMIFPLLLAHPKTWRLNLRALELVNEIKWPFYNSLFASNDVLSTVQIKKVDATMVASVNTKTIGALAESFAECVEEYMPWLIESCSSFEQSKTLFFLVMLRSFTIQKEVSGSFYRLFQACVPFLKQEWHAMESRGSVVSAEEWTLERLENIFDEVILGLMTNSKFEALNTNILISIYWNLVKAFPNDVLQNNQDYNGEWLCMLRDLFIFFATSSSKDVFKGHLRFLVMHESISPVLFLSKFFTEEGFSVPVQVESLHSFASICSALSSSESSGVKNTSHLQLLHGFPSLLVPLSSSVQDIRNAALKCIEGLYNVWQRTSVSTEKNGSSALPEHIIWTPIFGEFLGLILQQRKLILSDANFLPSFLTSMLSTSGGSLLVPRNIDKRFDLRTREAILLFILRPSFQFPSFGKLMVLSLLEGMGNSIMHVEEVNLLLSDLLERRSAYHLGLDKSQQRLSKVEIETLCLLLKSCALLPSSSLIAHNVMGHLFKALQVNGVYVEDPAIILPCITVLQKLNLAFYESLETELQDVLFRHLVLLFRHDNGDIQIAAREALLRIHVSCSTISRYLTLILAQANCQIGSLNRAKKKKPAKRFSLDLQNGWLIEEGLLSFLSALLDVLLLKKDIEDRASLIEPLFNLVDETITPGWLLGFVDQDKKESNDSLGKLEPIDGTLCYIQQAILSILEDITASLSTDLPAKDDILKKFNMDLLVECVRATKDVTTRNHVFSLMSTIAKVTPDQVLDRIIDIFTVICESAITQSDSHSQRIFEDLMSTVVPCWLSRTDNMEKLLQIFVNVLPEVAEYRRLNLMVSLLRYLGESSSLGSLLVLLFHSLIMRTSNCSGYRNRDTSVSLSSLFQREWEYIFGLQLCDQYSCTIWLPSLVLFLKQLGLGEFRLERVTELLLGMQFITHKLQDTELLFKLESDQDHNDLKGALRELMEQVVFHWKFFDNRNMQPSLPVGVRKELEESAHCLLRIITKCMVPTTYFKSIRLLLKHEDVNVRKKALELLCETVKVNDIVQKKQKDLRKTSRGTVFSFGPNMDEDAWQSFNKMCLEIIHLVDGPIDDSYTTVKLAAISAIEVLTNKFSSHTSTFTTCLTSITKYIDSDNLAVSSSCLRSTGALINALGARALPELPGIMEQVLKKASDVSSCLTRKFGSSKNRVPNGISSYKESLPFSILFTFEAVVEKLGGFLNPYLEDIIKVMALHREFTSESDQKIKLKAAAVRRLLTDKISVRLILPPLLKIYPEAIKNGESSVSIVFEMLMNMIGTMDRSLVGSYHVKIFELCLKALDLRCQHPVSIENINVVEQSVIDATVALTMKLTETMFRPIFVRIVEWAESELEETGTTRSRNFERNISFYRLVNKLTEQHRSLFVPYFKYLLESCTHFLTDDQYLDSTISKPKKKKAKVQELDSNMGGKKPLPASQWHLKALVVSSLYKCFLYDTGILKFLDSSNFQVLLKPIVSQLVADPPASVDRLPGIPTITEVDDLLVSCLGQMAITAGTDLLWKPLNHEVLMQTRSEKVRARVLGLRVVKYMLEHLKEEYLVLLPETIPFLGELLEDAELQVKSLAQQIFKEMETLSGENLRKHL